MKYSQYLLDEYSALVLYKELATQEKNPHNKEVLTKLAAQEQEHYIFWQKFIPGHKASVSPFFLFAFRLMRQLLGLTFTIKLLERHEHEIIEEYKNVAAELPGEEKIQLEKIIQDEKEHEDFFASQIQETVIKYIGFIALGLADAIVEITGTHAGFLGVTNSTLFAGISGLIVGFSAAISMGSAAYLQAKQDLSRSSWVSAIATGVSYIISAVMLALPYFFTRNMAHAFIFSTAIGILLIALLTFYSVVVFERRFLREFLETVFLMLGTALATFFLGSFLRKIFHL